MPAINNQVRQQLQGLISEEIALVVEKASKAADTQWYEAEREVCKQLGYGDTLYRIEHIKNQIAGLQAELAQLESAIPERSRPATVEEYNDAGLEVRSDRYGAVHPRPRVFHREIRTSWDCMVLMFLNKQLPFFNIHLNLQQLNHTVRRELLLCGNFEEARALYQQFHEKIGVAIGEEMPGLLKEVQAIPALQRPLET